MGRLMSETNELLIEQIKGLTETVSRLVDKATGTDFVLVSILQGHPNKQLVRAQLKDFLDALETREKARPAVLSQIRLYLDLLNDGDSEQ